VFSVVVHVIVRGMDIDKRKQMNVGWSWSVFVGRLGLWRKEDGNRNNRLNERVRELESRSAILDTNLRVQEDSLNHFIDDHWLPLQIMLINLHERIPLPCSHCAERVGDRSSPILPSPECSPFTPLSSSPIPTRLRVVNGFIVTSSSSGSSSSPPPLESITPSSDGSYGPFIREEGSLGEDEGFLTISAVQALEEGNP